MVGIKKRIAKKMAVCGVVCLTLTGCAETIIAGLTISDLLTGGSIVSSILTGKGLGEHALDVVTGQDCRILEAIFREDRAVCEPKDSVATKDDFKGLIALLDTPAGEDIQLAKIPMSPDQFTAVDQEALVKSKAVLATLKNRQAISIGNTELVADTRQMLLTKATGNYSLQKAPIANISTNELRERLTSGKLF